MKQPSPAAQIATDALAQLDAKKLTAASMHYLVVEDHRNRDHVTGNEYKKAVCGVCAQGALVVGYMTRLGNRQLGDYDERSDEVRAVFGDDNFELIETCYEGFSANDGVGEDYRYAFIGRDERLRKILENVVRNDGTFIPQQDLK